MKLLRILSTVLIFWNTLGILVLLWRYRTTANTKDRLHQRTPVSSVRQDIGQLGLASNIHRISRNLKEDKEDFLNVPDIYFNSSFNNRKSVMSVGIKGGRAMVSFPRLQDIRFNNVYWQTFEIMNEGHATYFLYSAYYDDRANEVDAKGLPTASVRIVSMVDVIPPPVPIRCALWFDNGQRMAWATAVNVEHLWRAGWGVIHNGTLQPCLISCLVPKLLGKSKIPDMVSLMNETQSRPTTNLKVRRDDRRSNFGVGAPKKSFAVCVKGLEFPSREDLAIRLLEWVHLLRILGADRVFFYKLDVHPTVARLLDYFQSKGMAKVIPLSLPGNQPNLPELRSLFLSRSIGNKRLDEIIPYNDCLYRNINAYQYVLLLDVDEVIMPLKSLSWYGLIRQILSAIAAKRKVTPSSRNRNNGRPAASYNVRNVYFFDDLEPKAIVEMDQIPEYLHMSRHVVRSSRFSKRGLYVKCFHDTDCVRSVHNHFPFSCLSRCRTCRTFDVDTELAELQHYRTNCHDMNVTECESQFKNNTVVDSSIRRFKEQLKLRVSADMEALQLSIVESSNVKERKTKDIS